MRGKFIRLRQRTDHANHRCRQRFDRRVRRCGGKSVPGGEAVRNRENLGFPKGNNIGIRASKGKYIYLLNSDIEVLDGCIDALADYMDVHPDIGMIGPKILNGDLSHQSTLPAPPHALEQLLLRDGPGQRLQAVQISQR